MTTDITAKRGVVFLHTIPCNMRPSEVRLHLGQYGEIFRQKFVPFPEKYVGSGNNRRLLPLQYKNGYVEFMDIEKAKNCAQQLNGNPVASKRRRKCFGQLWAIKVMGGDFTWDTVLEEREDKVRKHKQLEFTIRETEKNANEAFRRTVLANTKSKREALKAKRLPQRPALSAPYVSPAQDAVEAAPKKKKVFKAVSEPTKVLRVKKVLTAAVADKKKLVPKVSEKRPRERPESDAVRNDGKVTLKKKRRTESN